MHKKLPKVGESCAYNISEWARSIIKKQKDPSLNRKEVKDVDLKLFTSAVQGKLVHRRRWRLNHFYSLKQAWTGSVEILEISRRADALVGRFISPKYVLTLAPTSINRSDLIKRYLSESSIVCNTFESWAAFLYATTVFVRTLYTYRPLPTAAATSCATQTAQSETSLRPVWNQSD